LVLVVGVLELPLLQDAAMVGVPSKVGLLHPNTAILPIRRRHGQDEDKHPDGLLVTSNRVVSGTSF
jgi:hypothetical protein